MGTAYFLILYILCLLIPIRLERSVKRLVRSKILMWLTQVAIGLAILVTGFATPVYIYSQDTRHHDKLLLACICTARSSVLLGQMPLQYFIAGSRQSLPSAEKGFRTGTE